MRPPAFGVILQEGILSHLIDEVTLQDPPNDFNPSIFGFSIYCVVDLVLPFVF